MIYFSGVKALCAEAGLECWSASSKRSAYYGNLTIAKLADGVTRRRRAYEHWAHDEFVAVREMRWSTYGRHSERRIRELIQEVLAAAARRTTA